MKITPYLKLLRLDHWIKNVFMFPGVAIAITSLSDSYSKAINFVNLQNVFIALFALCVSSSANYTINEWLDRNLDQLHPYKKHRIASHYNFSAKNVYIQWIILVTIVFSTFSLNSAAINLYLTLLIFMGILYNVKPVRLKDRVYLDVISESVNNPIRFAIGWHTVNPNLPVPASAFLSFWGIGIFLMSLKRYSEMVIINDKILLGSYRKSFLHWSPDKLLVFAFAGALIAMTFIGVLLVRYRIEYIFVVPSLIWMFVEYLKMSLRLDLASIAPEKLMLKNRIKGLILLVAISFVLFSFTNIPLLDQIVSIKNE